MAALHHLALRTSDVAALAAFYSAWLGAKVVRELLPRALWLALEHDAVLMIERAEPGEPRAAPGSLDLLAFRVTRERRVELREQLLAQGLLEAETAHTLYFRDPDGRRLGLSSHPLLAAP